MVNDTSNVIQTRTEEVSGVFRIGTFSRYTCGRCQATIHELHGEEMEIYEGYYCPECIEKNMKDSLSDLLSFVEGGSW